MNAPFEALIATLQQELGAIHSCECMCMAWFADRPPLAFENTAV